MYKNIYVKLIHINDGYKSNSRHKNHTIVTISSSQLRQVMSFLFQIVRVAHEQRFIENNIFQSFAQILPEFYRPLYFTSFRTGLKLCSRQSLLLSLVAPVVEIYFPQISLNSSVEKSFIFNMVNFVCSHLNWHVIIIIQILPHNVNWYVIVIIQTIAFISYL